MVLKNNSYYPHNSFDLLISFGSVVWPNLHLVVKKGNQGAYSQNANVSHHLSATLTVSPSEHIFASMAIKATKYSNVHSFLYTLQFVH